MNPTQHLQAFYQSRHAQSEQLKGLFATIAQDECKHAEIAKKFTIFYCPFSPMQSEGTET